MPDELPEEPTPAEPGDLTARLNQLADEAERESGLEPEVPAAAAEAPAEPAPGPAAEPAPEPAGAETPPELPDAPRPPKAPVKRAPRKAVPTATPAKAPAARAAAKKAPAKTAPVKTTPAKSAAAKKAPAKKAPAKKLVKAAPDLGDRPATPWRVSPSPVPPPARRPRPELPVTATLSSPAPAQVPAVTTVPARERDGVVRFLVTLAVLLLAAAAGLGAAAFVEHRDRTYRADAVVRLDPGADPTLPIEDTLATGVTKYVALAGSHDFTLTAAQRAQVPTADLQGDVTATQRAARQIQVDVYASTAKQAQALATGAGEALVEAVNLQEAVDQTSPGDRLAAAVVVEAEHVTKTAPKDRDAWLAGALAAGAVLILAALAVVLRVTRRS